jgi:hypothetical protein
MKYLIILILPLIEFFLKNKEIIFTELFNKKCIFYCYN